MMEFLLDPTVAWFVAVSAMATAVVHSLEKGDQLRAMQNKVDLADLKVRILISEFESEEVPSHFETTGRWMSGSWEGQDTLFIEYRHPVHGHTYWRNSKQEVDTTHMGGPDK